MRYIALTDATACNSHEIFQLAERRKPKVKPTNIGKSDIARLLTFVGNPTDSQLNLSGR